MQTVAWTRRPLSFIERCHKRHGDVFTLRVRGARWVVLSDPRHVKQVFSASSELLGAGAGEANPLLAPLLGRRSVILLDEPGHMDDRKRLLPAFHGERLKSYGELIADVTRREIERWPVGEPFALWPRMQAISMQVVMRAVFGDLDGERQEELRERLAKLTDWVNDPRRLALVAAFGSRSVAARGRLAAAMRPVEEIVLGELRRRRAQAEPGEHTDILAMLEQAHRDDGSPVEEEKMRDELITLLSDGPTATSLAWAFERLLQHPDKLARLRGEVLAQDGEPYVDAVVKETLRLCPAIPLVMRRLIEPMRIGAYTIPAGTIVAPCIHLMHRRAEVYPDPCAFQPERFLTDAPGTYTWIPFGGGARRCVAASFAQLEMKKVIQTVLSELELESAGSGTEAAVRSSVSFAPSAGARVIARPLTASSLT